MFEAQDSHQLQKAAISLKALLIKIMVIPGNLLIPTNQRFYSGVMKFPVVYATMADTKLVNHLVPIMYNI